MADVEAVNVTRPVRGVALRQITEDDMPFLFRLFADPARRHLWMADKQVYDEREFHEAWVHWTSTSIATKFIVERGAAPIGLVFEYDRSLADGHTKVTALLDESRVGQGAGLIAASLLWDWLFQTFAFRKIYMDVYAYNPRVIELLRKLDLVEDGIVKEHRYWNGAWWDLHIFALYREAWPAIRKRILERPRSEFERSVVDPNADGVELNLAKSLV